MNQFALGYLFSRPTVEACYPGDILFIERNVYEYELAMEYAVCCYWLGKRAEAIRINGLVIGNRATPAHVADIAARNRSESEKLLAQHGPSSPEQGTQYRQPLAR